MVIDFVGCWLVEILCKHFFADLSPKPLVTRGSERRIARREEQERLEEVERQRVLEAELEKKGQ
jgi:cation-transporting ATPase 13A1